MQQINADLKLELLIWSLALVVLVVFRLSGRATRAGLVLTYAANLWLVHWLGGAVYAFTPFQTRDPGLIEAGFRQSTFAIVAFTVGVVALGPVLTRSLPFRRSARASVNHPTIPRLPEGYVLVGLVCFLVLSPWLNGIATLSAVLSTSWKLILVGLALASWRAWRQGNRPALFLWLVPAFGLPAATVVLLGFINLGAVSVMAIAAFVASFYRPRWQVLLAAVLITYLGLSVFVTYMRDRTEIRTVVWGGQSLSARFDRVTTTFDTIEWFDPANRQHLAQIDGRLNQNHLIGSAIDYLTVTSTQYANGETLWDGVLALVPRILWPDKTVSAGSMGFVSRFTGLTFGYHNVTAVGMGQVFELFINFGTAGIVGGFLILGAMFALIDDIAGVYLAQGNWRRFAVWYLVGLSLVQVEGSAVEMTASAAAALVSATAVNALLDRRFWHRTPVPPITLAARSPRATAAQSRA